MLIESTAYGGLLMLVLLSKIEEIDTFKSTNSHQNAVKTYQKISQIHWIKLDRSQTVKEPIKVKKVVFK